MNEELQVLCEAIIEGTATPEQLHRLEELVLADAEARRFYVEYLHQHGSLQWSAAEPELLPAAVANRQRELPGDQAAPIPGSLRSRFAKPVTRRWLSVAAGAVAAAVVVALWLGLAGRAGTTGQLATLVSDKPCKWDAGTLPTEPGARLTAGRLRLAEGIARIVFDHGAEVILEAPADFELVSAQRCLLHGGRLVAKVPSAAIGFTVDTPTAAVKDLGTEFGVNVRDAQTADVQVFDGIVDVNHRSSGKTERLVTGKNRRFGADAVSDFDPLAEKPVAGAAPPVADDARVVHISTATGRGKDAYVQPLYPSEHSSDILLLVKNTKDLTSLYKRKAYIGLDLSSVKGMRIVDAQLSVTFTPTGMGFASEVPDATFTVYGLTDETLDDWNERTMRWKDAPANRPGGNEVDPAKTIKLGTFEIPQGALEGTRSISGKALVDFLNADTNGIATFILVRETPGSGRSDLVHGFAAKRHPSLPPPTLKLTLAPR
jgi:ferric-dicitrate binding protein FerR (iron transport regulator)